MIGRSIYENTKKDIQDHATAYTKQLKEELSVEISLQKAIQRANRIANEYNRSIIHTTFRRLREIGNSAVDHYGKDLGPVEREQQVNLALDELIHSKYYSLTLPQRLRQSHLVLRQNIKRSAVVGAKKETRLLNITRIFHDTYPFGAHKNWDIRLFLAEAARLEHILAKNIAVIKKRRVIRWTLSDVHTQPDYCDQLARAVDKRVVTYINNQNLGIKPEGVYFIEDIPSIPHPNCQCEIQYIDKKPVSRKKLIPSRSLIQRILKAIFK